MTASRSYHAGQNARKPPPGVAARRGRGRGRWALIALALVAFALEGCQSLQNLNPCNPCRQGLFSNGLFNRRNVIVEPGLIADPGVVITEPGVVVEEPGVLMPGPPVGAPLPPAFEEDIPLNLSPIPENSRRPPSTSDDKTLGSRNAADRADYQTYSSPAPRQNQGSGNLAQTDSAAQPSRESGSSGSFGFLDLLPPPTSTAETPPPAPPENDSPPVAPEPEPEPDPVEPDEVRSTAPPESTTMLPEAASFQAAPGITYFSPVAPQLAGGSFPSEPGFEYLVKNSYRVLLDLRPPDQIRQEDIATIQHHGLRHILLPIRAETFNAETVAQFEDEIQRSATHRLYFCDTDGTRAAVLWYIHRIAVDQVDSSTARREAELVGPLDQAPALLQAAENYLASLQQTIEPLSTPPSAHAPPENAIAEVEPPAPPVEEIVADEPTRVTTATLIPRDPEAWRPLLALLLSVLSVPLAYWSRSTFNFRRRATRPASLEAPARKSPSLPSVSGAGT